MILSESPIISKSQDSLNRARFSEELAQAILSYSEKESLVIGLYGKWGSGKTSIINMAVEALETASRAQNAGPLIMRFNPWYFSDQGQLLSQFFQQMSLVLGRSNAERATEVGQRLKAYSRLVRPLSNVPIIGLYAKAASDALGDWGGAAEDWAKKRTDLPFVKDDLDRLLLAQSQKIIVIIDDIDRLNGTEIRQIFQLIKALGDFPNTVYLVAFDKHVVVKVLSKIQEGDGEEYLKKVIQVPFEVPMANNSQIEMRLLDDLSPLLEGLVQDGWDRSRWREIYRGLQVMFQNLRDVGLFMNSFRFSWGLVKHEVNPIDFIAITALKIFCPQVYETISENKVALTGGAIIGSSDELRKEAQLICEELLNDMPSAKKKATEIVLRALFPIISGAPSSNEYRKGRRICSYEVFDSYFRLSISDDDISRNKMREIISRGNDKKRLEEALLELCEQNKAIRFLDLMEDYIDEIPMENINTFVSVLVDLGDLLPIGRNDYMLGQVDSEICVSRLVHFLTSRYSDEESRYRSLEIAFENASKSLYTIVEQVLSLGGEHRRLASVPNDKRRVSEAHFIRLREIACRKIQSWAKEDRLLGNRRFATIMNTWIYWAGSKQAAKYLRRVCQSGNSLMQLLVHCVETRSDSFQPDFRINFGSMSKVLDYVEMKERLETFLEFYPTELDDKQKLAIATFMQGRIAEAPSENAS